MKTIKINVTKSDIENGLRHNCMSCPVARAASRHKELIGVSAGLTGFSFMYQNIASRIVFKKYITQFIDTFDKYGSSAVKPFSFKITL